MKVAYLGKIQLSDVDLSFLNEAQKLADITYIMEINPRFMKGPAFNIQQLYPKSGIFKAVQAYPEFRKFEGFIDTDKFYVINTCGKFWYLKSLWTYFLLLFFLVRNHFEVVHLAWPPNLYEFPIYFLRKKMMLTVHDPFPHTGLDTFIVRLRRKIAFNFIPRLIILNKAQKQKFIDFYRLLPERIIDSRLSCYTYLQTIPQQPIHADLQSNYILFCGKISPYKGLNYLLPAMEKVHRLFPACKLIIAGSGSFHFDITKYLSLDYIDLRNRFIPDEELTALINNSAFIVCPYTDATQSGVIMSAFAFNKPVIATNVGGLPEMVKHQHYGLIVEEKNVDALAEGIVTLLQYPNLLETYSREIKSDYSIGRLSWKQIAKDLCSEYERKIQ